VEAGTIVRPNETDLDPDVLYEAARGWITAPEPGDEIHLPSSDRWTKRRALGWTGDLADTDVYCGGYR
jgi:hypothetical protein